MRFPLGCSLLQHAIARASMAHRITMLRTLLASLSLLASFCQAAGTDVVWHDKGPPLRGQVFVHQAEGQLVMAVRRDWLAEHAPDVATQAIAEEADLCRQAWRQLQERLTEAPARQAGQQDENLQAFLNRESSRIDQLLRQAEIPAYQFIWVFLPVTSVRRVEAAEPDWRPLVQWGWMNHLPDVETLSRTRLMARLEAEQIDLTAEPPTLSDRLPPLPQTAAEWQTRLALLQDAYDSAVRFQGTGPLMLRTTQTPAISSALPLILRLLAGDLDKLLDGSPQADVPQPPTGNTIPPWVESVRQQASADGRFLATQVSLDINRSRVLVQSRFEVNHTDAGWGTIWQGHSAANAAQARPALEQRIATDPRVQTALDGLALLGITDQAAVSRSLRFGAATMEAQEDVDRRFATFRSSFTQALDRPPLPHLETVKPE
jgi:hypothetical protein